MAILIAGFCTSIQFGAQNHSDSCVLISVLKGSRDSGEDFQTGVISRYPFEAGYNTPSKSNTSVVFFSNHLKEEEDDDGENVSSSSFFLARRCERTRADATNPLCFMCGGAFFFPHIAAVVS